MVVEKCDILVFLEGFWIEGKKLCCVVCFFVCCGYFFWVFFEFFCDFCVFLGCFFCFGFGIIFGVGCKESLWFLLLVFLFFGLGGLLFVFVCLVLFGIVFCFEIVIMNKFYIGNFNESVIFVDLEKVFVEYKIFYSG